MKTITVMLFCTMIANCQTDQSIEQTPMENRICECSDGEFQIVPCDNTHDVVCQPCRSCETGFQFSEGSCSKLEQHDFECSNCTVCKDNQYEPTACTGHHDTVCKDCSVCEAGVSFSTEICGPEVDHDIICTPCTVCGDDESVVEACTLASDTVCVKKPASNDTISESSTIVVFASLTSSQIATASASETSAVTISMSVEEAASTEALMNSSVAVTPDLILSSTTNPASLEHITTVESTPSESSPISDSTSTISQQASSTRQSATSTGPSSTSTISHGVCKQCPDGEYEAIPCDDAHDTVCRACSVCTSSQQEAQPCQAKEDRVCQSVPVPQPPHLTILRGGGGGESEWTGYVQVSMGAGNGAFVNYSVTGDAPVCAGANGSASVSLVLSQTVTVRAVACAAGAEPRWLASAMLERRLVVKLAPSAVVSMTVTTSLEAGELTPARFAGLAGAIADALGVPRGLVEVLAVRARRGRRLLEDVSVDVDFRILAASAEEAQSVLTRMGGLDMAAVAVEMGFPGLVSMSGSGIIDLPSSTSLDSTSTTAPPSSSSAAATTPPPPVADQSTTATTVAAAAAAGFVVSAGMVGVAVLMVRRERARRLVSDENQSVCISELVLPVQCDLKSQDLEKGLSVNTSDALSPRRAVSGSLPPMLPGLWEPAPSVALWDQVSPRHADTPELELPLANQAGTPSPAPLLSWPAPMAARFDGARLYAIESAHAGVGPTVFSFAPPSRLDGPWPRADSALYFVHSVVQVAGAPAPATSPESVERALATPATRADASLCFMAPSATPSLSGRSSSEEGTPDELFGQA